jgi:hypothetical protein
MQTADRAAELLRQTETRLRSLLSEAATDADYSSVVQIASWARTLRDLTKSAPSRNGSPAEASIQKPGKTVAETPSHKHSTRRYQGSYPRFFRQGDQLVRVAWSRKEKKEYRHKTSYSTLKALVTALSEKGADGRVFSTDEVLPVYDSTDGSKMPDYQAYVVISLLKQTGLIDLHGRQGYSIPRTAQFRENVEGVWKKLLEE